MTFPVPSNCTDARMPQSKLLPPIASESESWHLPSEVFLPFAGALPLDLDNLRDNLDAFFVRIAHLGDESGDLSGSLAVTTWLVVATAVAFELARLRRPAASPSVRPGRSGRRRTPRYFTAKDES